MDKGRLDQKELLIPKSAKEYLEELLVLNREVLAIDQRRVLYKRLPDFDEKKAIELELEGRGRRLALKEMEARKLIDKVYNQLHRTVLTWKYINAWKVSQIAEELKLSENRTHKIVAEALESFDKVLNPRKPRIHERGKLRPPRWQDR